MFPLDCVLIIFLLVLLFFLVLPPHHTPIPILLVLLECVNSFRGTLSPVWLQREGIWLRLFFRSTNGSVVSDYINLTQILQACYGCTSEFSGILDFRPRVA